MAALADTTDFGLILSRLDASTCSSGEHSAANLAYAVYLDRLMGYVSQYLCKLLSQTRKGDIDGIVFSGGIGERAVRLRSDVVDKFSWLGMRVDEKRNSSAEGHVREISAQGTELRAWVVETDEEGLCAKMAREEFGF